MFFIDFLFKHNKFNEPTNQLTSFINTLNNVLLLINIKENYTTNKTERAGDKGFIF